MDGKKAVKCTKRGAMMNSMKFICESPTDVVSRSIIGLIGSPRARSRSPWLKNSSSTLDAHLTQSSLGLTTLEMSAQCNSTLSMNCLSSSVLNASLAGIATFPCRFDLFMHVVLIGDPMGEPMGVPLMMSFFLQRVTISSSLETSLK